MNRQRVVRVGISSTHLEDKTSLLRSIDHTRKTGFWGLEVFGRDLVSGSLTDAERIQEIRSAAEGIDLALTAHPWFDWTNLPVEDAVREFQALLDRCERLSAQFVNVHLNFFSTPDDGVGRVCDIIRPLIGQIEAAPFTLCFENVPANLPNPLGAHPEEFDEFFSDIDHPKVALTIDVGHAHVSGNLTDFATRLGPKWAYTHIADNHGESDEHLGPGMGTVDWSHFAGLMKSAAYDGPLIMEFPERYLSSCQDSLDIIVG